jgi:hypothetical protein
LVDQVIELTHAAQSQSRCLNKLFSDVEIVERRHLVTNAGDRIGFQVPALADIEARLGTQFHASDVISLEARDRLGIEGSNLRRIESTHGSRVEMTGKIGSERYALKNVFSKT